MTRFERPSRDLSDRALAFALRIMALCQHPEKQRGVVRRLGLQLLRASTSIGANCEEAQAGQSRADFAAKCQMALKEARESLHWPRLLSSAGLVPAKRLEPLTQECHEIVSILTTILKRTKSASS